MLRNHVVTLLGRTKVRLLEVSASSQGSARRPVGARRHGQAQILPLVRLRRERQTQQQPLDPAV
eukprot:5765311-Prymnesium_polylepis.1